MTSTILGGTISRIMGNSVEGQLYTRHIVNQRDQDIGMMIVEVQVTSNIQLQSKKNTGGIHCINGFEIKKAYLSTETADVGPLSKELLTTTRLYAPCFYSPTLTRLTSYLNGI
ncbi:hypothetical protein I4U23_012118 [Adineta vaga]|nr:hypothetical protein I4U23_012118 [Adineta vaga]